MKMAQTTHRYKRYELHKCCGLLENNVHRANLAELVEMVAVRVDEIVDGKNHEQCEPKVLLCNILLNTTQIESCDGLVLRGIRYAAIVW